MNSSIEKLEWYIIQLGATDYMVQIIVNFVAQDGDNIKMEAFSSLHQIQDHLDHWSWQYFYYALK